MQRGRRAGRAGGGTRRDDSAEQHTGLENTEVSERDFNDFLEAVEEDIETKYTPKPIYLDHPWRRLGYVWPFFTSARGVYDTPFFSVKQSEVCIEGHGCYTGEGTNYVAQGIWAAKAGETLDEALIDTYVWNQDPTDDELYWTAYGWYYYHFDDPLTEYTGN